jgi:hypothetical protein
MFSAMVVAILLMFVGDVIWSHSSSTAGVAQPVAVQRAAYPISLDQAGIIAQDTAPRATIIGTTTLTNYQGTVAYAVPMDMGSIYVEATTGRILANTVAAATSSSQHD